MRSGPRSCHNRVSKRNPEALEGFSRIHKNHYAGGRAQGTLWAVAQCWAATAAAAAAGGGRPQPSWDQVRLSFLAQGVLFLCRASAPLVTLVRFWMSCTVGNPTKHSCPSPVTTTQAGAECGLSYYAVFSASTDVSSAVDTHKKNNGARGLRFRPLF